MEKIKVLKLSPAELKEKGVENWPVWTKEVSEFPWSYDQSESCYIIEGQVTVTTAQEQVNFGPDDFVIFPQGLNCTWKIKEPVKKHYKFT
jgi:hypothetical protein